MQIAHNVVVSLIYTLRDASGAVLDQSSAAEPLAYLHGNGNLIPGLEQGVAQCLVQGAQPRFWAAESECDST